MFWKVLRGGEIIMSDLISVIMSTYNESNEEIRKSVNSILNQSYSNIEFIIVIDNPNNQELISCLQSFNDSRIKIIKNSENIGLVKSLNKAITASKGHYIARMDADDISKPARLEKQLKELKMRDLDIIGGNLELINEKGEFISRLNFPSNHKVLEIFLKWGNCLPHPTWIVKKDVYIKLKGYRNIPRCEDYDFICRALQNNFRIGNINDVVLQYRIRSDSVSNSNKGAQYVLRRFISKNRKKGVSENSVNKYLNSASFTNEIDEYEIFQQLKKGVREHPTFKKVIKLILNRNTYYLGYEKICIKIRNLL